MKRLPGLYLVFSLLALSSCNPYHYARQLPAASMFTDGGQAEVHGTLGFNHGELQASCSPIKGLGLSTSHFISYDSGMAHGLTLSYYKKIQKQPHPFYFTVKLGYERGLLTNSRSFFYLGSEPGREKNYKTSNYYSNLISTGIYWKSEKNIWFELDLTLAKTTFLSIKNRQIVWDTHRRIENTYFTNFESMERVSISPLLTMRFDEGPGRLFLKHSLGVNIRLSPPLKLVNSDSTYSQVQKDAHTLKLTENMIIWMTTLGFRFG